MRIKSNETTGCMTTMRMHVASKNETVMIAPGCHLNCTLKEDIPVDDYKNMCSSVKGDKILTFGVYFVLRTLATICLQGCFV